MLFFHATILLLVVLFFKLKVEFWNSIFTAEDNLKVLFGSKGRPQDTAVCDKDLKIYPDFLVTKWLHSCVE